jgi:hypothetical protein
MTSRAYHIKKIMFLRNVGKHPARQRHSPEEQNPEPHRRACRNFETRSFFDILLVYMAMIAKLRGSASNGREVSNNAQKRNETRGLGFI